MDFREAFLRAVTSYCSRPEHETPFPMPAGEPELCGGTPFWYQRWPLAVAIAASLEFYRAQKTEDQQKIARKAIKIFRILPYEPVFGGVFIAEAIALSNKEGAGKLYEANKYSYLFEGGLCVETVKGHITNMVQPANLYNIALDYYEDLSKDRRGKIARKIVKAYFANLEKKEAK